MNVFLFAVGIAVFTTDPTSLKNQRDGGMIHVIKKWGPQQMSIELVLV